MSTEHTVPGQIIEKRRTFNPEDTSQEIDIVLTPTKKPVECFQQRLKV
jgi:hypothetical protein